MKIRLLVLGWLFCTCLPVLAASLFPGDVTKFVEQRDDCDHFRGEYHYDEERAQFLQKNLKELCIGTDKKLAQLKEKYKTRSDIINKLNDYEPQIETGRKNP